MFYLVVQGIGIRKNGKPECLVVDLLEGREEIWIGMRVEVLDLELHSLPGPPNIQQSLG